MAEKNPIYQTLKCKIDKQKGMICIINDVSEKKLSLQSNLEKEKIQNTSKTFKGLWLTQQKIKYTVFISFNKKILKQHRNRKVWKIYKMMSSFIKTRDIYQCRNHHQKMIQKYHNIQNIIEEMENSFPTKAIRKMAKQYAGNDNNDFDQFRPKNKSKNTRNTFIQKKNQIEKSLVQSDQNKQIAVCIQTKSIEQVKEPEVKPQSVIQQEEEQRNGFLQALLYLQQIQFNLYYHSFQHR